MTYTAEDLMRERQDEVCRETADAMILGERWDDYYGFDCDDYDAYDPFGEEPDDDLFGQIEEIFGADADEIIADIICGQTADSAMQSHFID